MLFWSQLALFSLELVAREQFVPTVRETNALWRPVIIEQDMERLKIFFKSMPPSCLGLLVLQKTESSPSNLVTSFLDNAVNSLVHNSLLGVTLMPSRRGRPPKAVPLAQQFLAALTSKEPGLKASSEEITSFSREIESWTSQILPKVVDVPFRTCFRLEAPRIEDEGEVPGEHFPIGLEMQTDEAYSFLREEAPLLEQNGFGVLLPSWWERPNSRLSITLRLKDAPKKERQVGPAFFGLNSLVNYDWQLSLGGDLLTEAEFAELARLKVPLIQIRGEWMELRSTEIEAAIAFFKRPRKEDDTCRGPTPRPEPSRPGAAR